MCVVKFLCLGYSTSCAGFLQEIGSLVVLVISCSPGILKQPCTNVLDLDLSDNV